MAHVCAQPASMSTRVFPLKAPLVWTATGVAESIESPFPSCPEDPRPQQYAAPSMRTHRWKGPAPTSSSNAPSSGLDLSTGTGLSASGD